MGFKIRYIVLRCSRAIMSLYKGKMMNIKLNWALTPYLRSHNDSLGGSCLVSVDGFVDKNLFELIKSEWAGYVQKNGKKTALYNLHVIDTIIKAGHSVTLEGTQMTLDYNFFDGTSQNSWVKSLSSLYQQSQVWKEQSDKLILALKDMFATSVKENEEDTVFGISKSKLQWTHIKLKDNVEYEFKIDVNYGIQECMTWEEPSHEYFVPIYFYKTLKPGHSANELKELVEKIRSLPKAPEFNHEQKWQEGYDPYTFEPKRNDWRWKNYQYNG